jgi:hypothetical protein
MIPKKPALGLDPRVQAGFRKRSRSTKNLGHDPISRIRVMVQALVAQLDRASDFESEGREFESLRARHLAPRGQLSARQCDRAASSGGCAIRVFAMTERRLDSHKTSAEKNFVFQWNGWHWRTLPARQTRSVSSLMTK